MIVVGDAFEMRYISCYNFCSDLVGIAEWAEQVLGWCVLVLAAHVLGVQFLVTGQGQATATPIVILKSKREIIFLSHLLRGHTLSVDLFSVFN
jgi:hypothetical protein